MYDILFSTLLFVFCMLIHAYTLLSCPSHAAITVLCMLG